MEREITEYKKSRNSSHSSLLIPNSSLSRCLFGVVAVFCAILAVKNLIVLVGQAVPDLLGLTTPARGAVIVGAAALFFAGVVWVWIKLRISPKIPLSEGNVTAATGGVNREAGIGGLSPDRPEHVWRYYAALFLAALALSLTFTFVVHPPAISDFKGLYEVTNQIAAREGLYPYGLYKQYFSAWAYQTGFPAFMSPVAMLFPNNLDALLTVNNLFGAGTVLCLFYLLQRTMPVRRAFFLSLGYLLLPFPYTVAAVYTNQLSSAFFIYLGLCLIVSKTPFDLKRCAVGALCVSVGNMLRPEGILVLAAVLALLLILLFVRGKKSAEGTVAKTTAIKAKVRTVLPLALFCAVYLAANAVLSQVFVLTGLNPNGLRNTFPLYKFAVGLNEQSVGQYNKPDADDLFRLSDEKERDQYAREVIAERLSVGPERLTDLFFRKLDVLWTDQTKNYPALWGRPDDGDVNLLVKEMRAGMVKNILMLLDSLWFALLFALCVLTAVRALRAREIPAALPLLAAFLLAAIMAFSAVEAQRRYAYLLMPCVWIFANAKILQKCGIRKQERDGEEDRV